MPVIELNAQLAGALRRPQHLFICHAKVLIKATNGGNGRLTHPDGFDLARFNQRDRDRRIGKVLLQARGRHPAGGTTAHDHYRSNWLTHHTDLIPQPLESNYQKRRKPLQGDVIPCSGVRMITLIDRT